MYTAQDPWMSADDGRGRLLRRHCRPSPSCLKKTAPFPSCPRTDGTVDITAEEEEEDLPPPLVPPSPGQIGHSMI